MARTQVFISYAHLDDTWRQRVVSQLKVLVAAKLIDLWDDRKLEAGEKWLERINGQMARARIAVLLISSHFLGSDFILSEEVPKLFRRHRRNGMRIYPLLIKACAWQEVEWLAGIQIRPDNGRAVAASRGNRVDEILSDVAREIASIARAASKKKKVRKHGVSERVSKARTHVPTKRKRVRSAIRKPSSRKARPK